MLKMIINAGLKQMHFFLVYHTAAAAAAAAAAKAEAEALKVVQFFKRPCPRLVDSYRQSWKPAHNHFERYSDVKLKGESHCHYHTCCLRKPGEHFMKLFVSDFH